MMTLGKKLKSIRESKNLGQKDVEKATGISYKTLSNYENDRSEPDVEKLALLCKVYEVSADYFINSEFEALKQFNFFLHLHEQETIKKYRELDPHGKELVDYVLNHEHARRTQPDEIREDVTIYHLRPLQLSEQSASAGKWTHLGPGAFSTIMVERNDLTDRAAFAVPVSGDSMEPKYFDRDILLIEGTMDLNIGDIGLFTFEGSGYVKKVGNGELFSLNPKYPPIKVDETLIINGKVIGTLDPEWIAER